jgi:hypothetical protein
MALMPLSTNLGQFNLESLTAARTQTLAPNPGARFSLYRIGDAWVSRNIHAAMRLVCICDCNLGSNLVQPNPVLCSVTLAVTL